MKSFHIHCHILLPYSYLLRLSQAPCEEDSCFRDEKTYSIGLPQSQLISVLAEEEPNP